MSREHKSAYSLMLASMDLIKLGVMPELAAACLLDDLRSHNWLRGDGVIENSGHWEKKKP